MIGYDQSLAEPLRAELDRLKPASIGLSFSRANHTSDGLTLGMYLSLLDCLTGTVHRDRLVSADRFASALRGRKTPGELARIQAAVDETAALLAEVPGLLRSVGSERELQAVLHDRVFLISRPA